jgi:phospholipase D1/2
VLSLYQAAIARAEALIYVETQYFSSRAIADALEQRLRERGRSTMQLVFILNMLREQAAVGLAQAQNIERLRKVAAETGHAVGLYYTLPRWEPSGLRPERGTYIHAKVMLVHDRLLTVGSANLTNRSMGVDTELNVTVEATSDDDAVARSIRRVGVELLAEHSGLEPERLEELDGLVDRLERAMGPDGEAATCGATRRPRRASAPRWRWSTPTGCRSTPDHVEPFDADQRAGLLRALSRAARELLSSARVGPALQPRSPLETE